MIDVGGNPSSIHCTVSVSRPGTGGGLNTVTTSGRIAKMVDTYTKTGGSGVSLRMGYDYVNCTTLARYSQWTGATFTQKPGTSVSRTFYPASPPTGKPSVCVRGLLVDTIAGTSFTTAIGHFGLN